MREKTKAFHRLKDDVPSEIKNKRYLEMVETFRACALDLNQSKLNQTHLVLIDKVSKRSESEYSGRNDNNTIVHFEKKELPFLTDLDEYDRLDSAKKQIPQVGDYVACKLNSCTSHSFRSEPLFSCSLQTFDRIKKSNFLG